MGVPASSGLACNDKAITSLDRANGLVTGTLKAVGPGKAFPVWGPMNFVAYGSLAQALTVAASGSNAATVSSTTNINPGDSVQSTLAPPGTTVATASGGNITFAFPTQMWPCVLINSPSITFPNGVPVGCVLSQLVGATINDPNGYFGSGVTVLAVGADGKSLQVSAAPTSIPSSGGTSPVPIEFALTANCLTAGTDANATFSGSATPLGGNITLQLERSFDGGSTWIGCNIGGAGQLAKFTNPTSPISVAFGDPEAGALYRVNCLAFSGAVANTSCAYRWSTTGQAGIVMSTPAIS